MSGPLSAIWIPAIPIGLSWRRRGTCLSKTGRFLAAALLVSLLGCTGPAPQPTGLRLTQVRFSDLPQWNASQAALASFQRSCAILTAKPDSEAMGSYAGTVGDWRAVCGGTNS